MGGDRFEPVAAIKSVSDQGKQTLFGALMTMSGGGSGGGVKASAYVTLQVASQSLTNPNLLSHSLFFIYSSHFQALCYGDPERPVQLRVLHRAAVLGIIQVPVSKLLAGESGSFHLEVCCVDILQQTLRKNALNLWVENLIVILVLHC